MPFYFLFQFAKFRTEVVPLRLETGRYENLAVNQRTCFNCKERVESVQSVLLKCSLYEDLREIVYNEAFSINSSFYSLSEEGKITFMFTSNYMIKIVAKTCKDILDRRRSFLYK